MAASPDIERYYASLAELVEAGSTNNELNISSAFQNCLAAYCATDRNELVPELAVARASLPTHCLTQNDTLRKWLPQSRRCRKFRRRSRGGGISRMAKQKLLASVRDRYRTSSKDDKSRILDEFIATIDSDRAFLETSPMDRPSASHQMLTLFKIG